MDNRDTLEKQWEELTEKIKDIKFAMLTTENEDGFLHSRPMATLEADSDRALWFFTGKSTLKAREIGVNPKVNLAYADGGHNTFISVAGEARLFEDRAKAEKLWNPIMKAWFPKGLDDPDLVLLKVEIEEAEYWDPASKRMLTLIRFAKSMAGADPHEDPPGHGRLQP